MEKISNLKSEKAPESSVNDIRYSLMFLLGTIILVWFIQLLWSRRKLYIYSWNIPGPIAFPLIGNAYLAVGLDHTGVYKRIEGGFKKYPEICRVWFGPKLYFLIKNPEYIEKVLTRPETAEKDEGYEIPAEFLGNGLITAPVKIWKPHRKSIVPCMNQKILNSYVPTFSEKSIEFVKRLKGVIGKKDVDWSILTTRYALETFGKTNMGVELNVLHTEPSDEDIGMLLKKAFDIGAYRFTSIACRIPGIWALAPVKKQFDKYINLMTQICKSYIQDAMEVYKEQQNLKIEGKQKLNLLELLLHRTNFTEEELIDEIKTMLAAAVDTTGLSMCSIFMMLGMHPDIQEKVYEEAIDVLGHDRGVEVSDLPLLKYTERVIKESLRLFPPATLFGRKVTADLDLGKLVIPKGSSVALFPTLIHREPQYWQDPLKFDPDRFLPEEVVKRHPCSYIPFSYGPRNCIGWQNAMMNLKTVISTVIRQLKVFTDYKSVEEIEIQFGAVLALKDGFRLRFELRPTTR